MSDNISKITVSLYKAKAKFPFLRTGQIIVAFHDYLNSNNSDAYYISDELYGSLFDSFIDSLMDCSDIICSNFTKENT